MLFTGALDRGLRGTYRVDTAAGVIWAVFTNVLNGFALVLARRAGAGPELLGAAISVMYVPPTLAFVMPWICKRIPLGLSVVLLRLLAGVAMLYCIFNPTLVGLAISFSVAMVGWGYADVGYPALFNALYPVKDHARAMGLQQTERSIAITLGLLALGKWLDKASPTDGIRTLGILGILGIISALTILRFARVREETHEASAGAGLRAAFTNKPFLLYAFSLAAFGAGGLVFGTVWPIMQVDLFKLTNAQVGYLAAAQTLAITVTFYLFSRYGEVKASSKMLTLPYTLSAMHLFNCALLLFLPRWQGQAFWVLLAAMMLSSVGGGIQGIYFYLLVNAMAGKDSALAYQSAQNVIIGIRGIIMPLAAGFGLRIIGLHWMMVVAMVLTLLGIALTQVPVQARTVAPEPIPVEDV